MSQRLDLRNVSKEAKKDILELQHKIDAFKSGEMNEERFKHYRLTRGVYGQRQLGVQMFRIKIPYGKLTSEQLIRIADISQKYTNGNLHLTTRQDIQYHYVKLDDSPAIWTELAQKGITAREACGNVVRNLTASAAAGVDPDELFDVTPYAHASAMYFLRNPICQDMGRKMKPAFSSSDKDSAYTYFHDFGFIPRLKKVDGKEVRGFKVVIAGGLGAQSIVAQTAFEFLEENKIIPFMEASIRVFDRYGEREKRMKARMKFLVQKIGLEGFMKLVAEQKTALKNQTVEIDTGAFPQPEPAPLKNPPTTVPVDEDKFKTWLATNVFEQKQKGFYAVQLRVQLGNIPAENARRLARLAREWAADDIRITVNQGFLLRFIRPNALPYLFNELDKLGLGEPGFDSIADITACPGTDTCNLGVTNSTGLATKLEEVIREEYPDLILERDIKIKISGCMNACGQHMAANIGFHGSSIKKRPLVIPAMQVVIGGGVDSAGQGFVAERVIKLPTKQIPEALRLILDDFEENSRGGDSFNDYYYRLGKRYFYELLKHLSPREEAPNWLFFDWGQEREYRQAIGVGECAGVAYDMVAAILNDAKERLQWAEESFEENRWADSIYHSYSSMVIGAKAMLLSKDVKCNTQKRILDDFDANYVETGEFNFEKNFAATVLEMNQKIPSEGFAQAYFQEAKNFFDKVTVSREKQFVETVADKLVVENYYNA